MDYINDYVGVGVPSITSALYVTVLPRMSNLGLTVSENKLVASSTQLTYLGIMIDTVKGTIAIPPDKVDQIITTVLQRLDKSIISKH